MRRTILQGLTIAILFFGAWVLLSMVNWVAIFKPHRVSDLTEKKLGETFWQVFRHKSREINDRLCQKTIDTLVTSICRANNIKREGIKVHLLGDREVNAFALPDGHLVINSGLIAEAESVSELCGVIAHEIAHIQKNHVMKKLIREVGLSVLVSMTGGKGAGEAARKAAHLLSSSAYDRDMEKEADLQAVDYMLETGLDPEHFAAFLYRLSDKEPEAMSYFAWLSTHPDSKMRAEYILDHAAGSKGDKELISSVTWEKLKFRITADSY